MELTITQTKIDLVQAEWSELAKEPIRVEHIGGTLYAFGSELATLRIYHKFRGKGRVAYSENCQSWYYSKDLEYFAPSYLVSID